MAEKKQTTTPQKKTGKSNEGFTVVQKTTVTVYQNSKGVKRTVKETTSAPSAKKQSAPKPQQAKKGGKK